MSRPVVHWAFAAIMVAACTAIGVLLVCLPFPAAKHAPETLAPLDAQVPAPASPPSHGTSATDRESDDWGIAPNSAEEICARLEQILALPDLVAQRYQIEAVFDAMTAEQARDVYAALLNLPVSGNQASLVASVFERWGQVDGRAALETALQIPGRRRANLSAKALQGWAKTDPVTAWEEARKLSDGWAAFEARLRPVIAQLAKVDFATALKAARDLRDIPAKRTLQWTLADVALKEGKVDVLLAEISDLDSIADQEAWAREVFFALGRTKPDAALAGLANLSNSTVIESAMAGFLTAWSSVDPEGAIDYALDHHDDPAVSHSLPDMLRRNSYNLDRVSTVELVDRVVAMGKVDLLGPVMIPRIAQSHPEIAANVAQALSDQRAREAYTSMAIARWAREEFQSALSYYEALPADGSKLESLQAIASSALSRSDGGAVLSRLVAAVSTSSDQAKAVDHLLIAAANPRVEISSTSRQALQKLVAETPGVSADGRARAEKLFGSSFAK